MFQRVHKTCCDTETWDSRPESSSSQALDIYLTSYFFFFCHWLNSCYSILDERWITDLTKQCYRTAAQLTKQTNRKTWLNHEAICAREPVSHVSSVMQEQLPLISASCMFSQPLTSAVRERKHKLGSELREQHMLLSLARCWLLLAVRRRVNQRFNWPPRRWLQDRSRDLWKPMNPFIKILKCILNIKL